MNKSSEAKTTPVYVTLILLVVLLILGAIMFFMPEASHAQEATPTTKQVAHPIPRDATQGAIDFLTGPFPIGNAQRNADNLPIYLVECNNGNCYGPTGEPVGTEKEVAAQLPLLPASLMSGHGYHCHYVCWDHDNNVIAANPALFGKQ